MQIIKGVIYNIPILKVSGKVNARDRDGVLTDEAKINAEEITVVTDEELDNYESTGATLKTPTKGVAQKKSYGKTAATSVGGGGYRRSAEKPATQFRTSESDVNAQPLKPKKLFVRVEDSSNTKALMDLKKMCGTYPGLSEVILVVGPEKKAMRMPFKVDVDESVLVSGLKEIFGEEGVIAK